jgi:hypothetical protein
MRISVSPPSRRRVAWLTGIVVAQWVLLACNSGLMVTPTSATPGPGPTPTPPPVTDIRITLFLSGTLEDGGTFDGYITYADTDQDEREDFGRFAGGLWELVVHGGSRTKDARFAHGTGGRALIETNSAPFPAIGLVFLWPDFDPVRQAFTPHVMPLGNRDPDAQPMLRDFGPLIPGSPTTFGTFVDGEGGEALVTSLQIR